MKTELVYINGEVWKIPAEELPKYLKSVIEHTGYQGIDTVGGKKILDNVINISYITEERAHILLRQLK